MDRLVQWLVLKWKGVDERYSLAIVGVVTFAISIWFGLYSFGEAFEHKWPANLVRFYIQVASLTFATLSVRRTKRKWELREMEELGARMKRDREERQRHWQEARRKSEASDAGHL